MVCKTIIQRFKSARRLQPIQRPPGFPAAAFFVRGLQLPSGYTFSTVWLAPLRPSTDE